jgi:hypothetical protein
MATVGQVLRGPIGKGRGAGRTGLVLAAFLSAWPAVGHGQEALLPIANQVPLMLKVLTYESGLMLEPADTIRVGILYRPRSADSERCFEEFSTEMRKYEGFTVRGRTVSLVPLLNTGAMGDDWPHKLLPLDVLYVAPGSGDLLSRITKITRSAKILTITGIESYVDDGLSMGLFLANDGPEIAINMSASHQEGCEWEGSLLQVCRLIR